MDKLVRSITLAVLNGMTGAVYGAVTGCLIGFVAGLVFGGIWESIVLGVWFSVVLDSFVLAVAAVVCDDGDGMGPLSEFLDVLIAWRKVMSKPVVLFLCTHNTARSQMAEAILKRKAADHFDAYSAGTDPKESIHPLTVRVMKEVGIDLIGQKPKALSEYLGRLPVKVAISVCPKAEDKCPTAWPGTLSQLEWPVEDPTAGEGSEDERLARFRSVRDQIDQKITSWLTQVTVPR